MRKIHSINNIIKHVVCWILLLQIINISIDPPDLKLSTYSIQTNKEDLSVNEIESVYEMIAEGVFDEKVPESDENDVDSSSPSIELYFFNRIYTTLQRFDFPIKHYTPYSNTFLSVYHEPHFPPPKNA